MNQTPRHFVEERRHKEDSTSNDDKPKQRIGYVRNSSGGAVRVFFNSTVPDKGKESI